MNQTKPVEIDGSLNYDESSNMYWHGVLGWVPDYVEQMKNGRLGIYDGELYRYLHHTGKLGDVVHVYFNKVQSSCQSRNR